MKTLDLYITEAQLEAAGRERLILEGLIIDDKFVSLFAKVIGALAKEFSVNFSFNTVDGITVSMRLTSKSLLKTIVISVNLSKLSFGLRFEQASYKHAARQNRQTRKYTTNVVNKTRNVLRNEGFDEVDELSTAIKEID